MRIIVFSSDPVAYESVQEAFRERNLGECEIVTADPAQPSANDADFVICDFLLEDAQDAQPAFRAKYHLKKRVLVIDPRVFVDFARGFQRFFQSRKLTDQGIPAKPMASAGSESAGPVATVKQRSMSRVRAIGGSSWIGERETLLRQIGASDVPVLVNGETGVGKEVVARTLHLYSPRAERRFLKVNCAALPSDLIESELFGYERGAFTGAGKTKLGKFDNADEGTILLDEIGDMDVRLQAKLLQVLQDQEFERLGGSETIRVNVRVIAATHVNLEQAVAAGVFRADLYYRLNVVNLVVPPLRDRKNEILSLAEHFVERYTTMGSRQAILTDEMEEALLAHDWPGNVRELENCMRKYAILQDPASAVSEIRSRLKKDATSDEPVIPWSPNPGVMIAGCAPPSLEGVTASQKKAEREAILAALTHTRWNRRQAARLLGVDYKALLYKMKKLDIAGDGITLSKLAAAG